MVFFVSVRSVCQTRSTRCINNSVRNWCRQFTVSITNTSSALTKQFFEPIPCPHAKGINQDYATLDNISRLPAKHKKKKKKHHFPCHNHQMFLSPTIAKSHMAWSKHDCFYVTVEMEKKFYLPQDTKSIKHHAPKHKSKTPSVTSSTMKIYVQSCSNMANIDLTAS